MPVPNNAPKLARITVVFDNEQAIKEGWALFNDGELQRLDQPAAHGEGLPEDPVFTTDRQAVEFVLDKALAGSRYHQDAINFVLTAAAKEAPNVTT